MKDLDPKNISADDVFRNFISEDNSQHIQADGQSGSFSCADDFSNISGGEYLDLQGQNGLEYSTDFDLSDIDFSSLKGDCEAALNELKNKLKQIKKKKVIKRKQKGGLEIPITKSAVIIPKKGFRKTINNILVPDDRQLTIEGVDKFILGGSKQSESIRKMGYHNGKPLKQLMLNIDNSSSAVDLNLNLFNVSEPLDYFMATGLNLNDKITIAGGQGMSYSDVLFNILGNPTLIPNAKINYSGSNTVAQTSQVMRFTNTNIEGALRASPMQMNLNIDIYQYQSNIVYFDIDRDLNRPFIPDGSETISYTVLAGNSVSICFFYKQHSLKKFFIKEARDSKILI